MAIKITYQTQDYILKFTRESVKKAEDLGFVFDKLSDKPETMVGLLFYSAFLAEHKRVSRELTDEIFSSLKNKQTLIQKLAEMYAETIENLFDEGNLDWVEM